MYFNWQASNNVDELKRMVDLGIPYPDIAQRLGITVGSVCGKVHRLGIGKGPPKPDRLFIRPKSKQPPTEPDAAFFEIMERQQAEVAYRGNATIALEALEDHHCRYVIGEPADGRLCGVKRHDGTPYCEDHARGCYSPVTVETREAISAGNQGNPCNYPRNHLHPALMPAHRAVDPRTLEEADPPDAIPA